MKDTFRTYSSILFTLTISLFACKKESNGNGIQAISSLKYNMEGRHAEIINSTPNIFPSGHTWAIHYNISGGMMGYSINGQYTIAPATINQQSKYVTAWIGLDTVSVGQTYSMANTSGKVSIEVQDEGFLYFAKPQYAGTACSITITEHQNAEISGSFSGTFKKLSQAGGDLGLVTLTNGEFDNIQVTY